VSHEGVQKGPYSLDEVVVMLKNMELSVLDYIYDDKKEDWVLLMDHPELSKKVHSSKPKAAPAVEKAQDNKEVHAQDQAINTYQNNAEWFVLKGANKFGPFPYMEVVKMLQEKVVYEFDFVWKQGFDAWKRIAQIPDFHYDHIKKLKETLMPEIKEVFFRRKHPRVDYQGIVLVHDNKNVWKGFGEEISVGGAGVVMDNALLIPGQDLYLHFKSQGPVMPFNAICEIVSKRFIEGVRERNASIRYGLRFKDISPSAQKLLKQYTGEEAA